MHDKLGHPSKELTINTSKRMGVKLKNKKGKCVACVLAKSRKKSIKKRSVSRSTIPGERLYVDISSVKTKSKGGSNYWLQIADDATPKKWSFFIKKK